MSNKILFFSYHSEGKGYRSISHPDLKNYI